MYEDGALRNALWQLFTQVLELQKCRSVDAEKQVSIGHTSAIHDGPRFDCYYSDYQKLKKGSVLK